jgi:hypothetical protein
MLFQSSDTFCMVFFLELDFHVYNLVVAYKPSS